MQAALFEFTAAPTLTIDGIFAADGSKIADVVHDEVCGLFYVGDDMENVESFAGCAETLQGAFDDWRKGPK